MEHKIDNKWNSEKQEDKTLTHRPNRRPNHHRNPRRLRQNHCRLRHQIHWIPN